MKLLNTFFSQDQMRTAWIFDQGGEFLVEILDSINHKEYKFYFNDVQEAESFAEGWVE